jgi:hypothetical protein
MPLYEVVLRYENRDELRLTDRDPRTGSPLHMNGRRWHVVASTDGTPPVAGRFILEPVPVVDSLEALQSA